MQEPLYRRIFEAATLLKQHPPQFHHPHKKALFELAYPDGNVLPNQICVTRWAEDMPDSISAEAPLKIDVRPDFFDYKPTTRGTAEWHVNFADTRLFVAYGSHLFAQDEMQVAEHPLLASVREGLLADGLEAETTDGVRCTPILIRNVERRLEISVNADGRVGRPYGLYGNRFGTSPLDVVLRASRKIDPPTITNIIAMAAPALGKGEYTKQQIESIFATAFTAFSSAHRESISGEGFRAQTVVHTSFWGCGAFGGNRNLMVALQVLAAKTANVSQLIFHAGDQNGLIDVRRGLDTTESFEFRCGPEFSVDALATCAVEFGYRWGIGDGN